MPIEFANIPAGWKMPLYWVEIDPSMAGLPVIRKPLLMVGQKISSGAQANDVPLAIGNLAQARAAWGRGSMLASMFEILLKNTFSMEMYGVSVADPGSGAAKASGTITVTSPPTDSGVIALYIANRLVRVNVASGDTAAEVATKIVSAVQANDDLPVSAVAPSGDAPTVVHLTCKWFGSTGNDIDVRDSYKGALGGEQLPPGLALTYSGSGKLAGGSGDPGFDTAIANLSDEAYEYVAMPYTDATSISAWTSEYGFSDTGRWGWMRQGFGHVFSARRGLYDALSTWGSNNNSGVISYMGFEVGATSPSWDWAAAYAAKSGRSLANDPARPLQTLELEGIGGAPKHERFNITELNDLATRGIATQRMGPNGVPQIMRETTSYQLNSYGQGDDAYELVTTLATLAALIRNQRYAITTKFPRHKLADDGTRFGVGQKIVTPSIIKAELIAQYRADEFNGLVENVRAFKNNLIVERDPNDPNRLNVLYPPDLVNQLRVFAVLAQFRLQYDRGFDPLTA